MSSICRELSDLIIFVFFVLCVAGPVVRALPVQINRSDNADRHELIDMSYAFDNDTVYWPSADPADRTHFNLTTMHAGVTNFNDHQVFYQMKKFAAPEHGGTHIDAPSHFVANGLTVADLPLSSLIGAAVKIDIEQQSQTSRDNDGVDYLMTTDDVLSWETQHGKIPNNSLVFVHTGYGKFWPDQLKYIGYDGVHNWDLHYPGISEAAAELLVERGVKAIGIDTVSPDNMRNTPLVHGILLRAGVIIIENVAKTDRLPATGANVYGLPMKIAKSSGAPLRLLAQVPV